MFGYCLHPQCDTVFEYEEDDRYHQAHLSVHEQFMVVNYNTEACCRFEWNRESATNYFAKFGKRPDDDHDDFQVIPI